LECNPPPIKQGQYEQDYKKRNHAEHAKTEKKGAPIANK
jgi:hypothetical protein